MSWEPEIRELQRRMELARRMGGEANVERQHKGGKLTVRERIDRLLDKGSFHETGALAGVPVYEDGRLTDVRPANFVMGTGCIDGRRVVVGGDDFTVRGGAADGSIRGKQIYSERMALDLRLPLIRLVDGTGGGGSVKTYEQTGRTYVPGNPGYDLIVRAMSEIPVVGACMGSVAGLGAARVAASHFSVMVRGSSQLFVAGPPVVKRGIGEDVDKETLGGSHIHARGSGAVDNEAESEEEAFDQIRRFLSYLPSNVWEAPPLGPQADDPARREEELLSIIPRSRRRGYDARRMLRLVFDHGSIFEIAPYYGRPQITGLARLNGRDLGQPIHPGERLRVP